MRLYLLKMSEITFRKSHQHDYLNVDNNKHTNMDGVKSKTLQPHTGDEEMLRVGEKVFPENTTTG